MNNNHGVSLLALTIAIIAIMILSAIVIRVGTSGIDVSIEARYSTEKKEIQSAIIYRFSDYSVNKGMHPLIGKEVSLSEISSIEGIRTDDIEYIRKLDKGDIQDLSINNTTEAQYIVDYFTGEVFGPFE